MSAICLPVNPHCACAHGTGGYDFASGPTKDTLQGIARALWGDATLWYLIAEANGIDAETALTEGQVLVIPPRSTTLHNDFQTFKPYSATEAVGDMTPNLPMPAGADGCGGVGTIIMIIVAVVATVLTAGALSGVAAQGLGAMWSAGVGVMGGGSLAAGSIAASLGSFGTAFVAGAVGSVVSQGVGIAIGAQDSFSWKSVALSAVSAGVSGGMGGWAPTGNAVADMAIRAAVGNTITQGVGVATGLQDSFSWRSVAASAVGAGVGGAVGQGLQGTEFAKAFGEFGVRAASGFAGGMAAAAMRGSRVSVQQAALDGFGNAIANSIVGSGGNSQQYSELEAEQDLAREMNRGSWQYNPAADPEVQAGAQRFLAMNPLAANEVQNPSQPRVTLDAGTGRYSIYPAPMARAG